MAVSNQNMSVVLSQPGVAGLSEVVRVLREWQYDGAPMQLHPGDLGWYWRFGAQATAAAVRTWSRDGVLLAVGLLDGPRLVRLAIAPDARYDEALAERMVADVTQAERGVLPRGDVSIEARWGGVFQEQLVHFAWDAGEPWTPLFRDLTEPVGDCGARIELIGLDRARVRVAVQRAAFDGSTFTDERWHQVAAGLPYTDARCLVAYDEPGTPVAAATVWSAGWGKPGLLEPLGVHRDHRGLGFGTAITVAAAAILRELGSFSATVCTPSSNAGAIATYTSAGFQRLRDVPELHRSA